MTSYGFIGTGAITEAIITGLMASPLAGARVIVSPRNHQVAAGLARRFAAVSVAASNQAVVDAADVLILAIRPQVAEEVLRALVIPPGKKLVSLIAATSHAALAQWTGQDAGAIVRAIPLPFVATREGVTAVFPADTTAEQLFNAMGTAVVCHSQEEFDLFGVTSALMGSYFGLLERLSEWLTARGMSGEQARAALLPLFASLARTAQGTNASFAALRAGHSTRGGLNEQVFADFEAEGGTRALFTALDKVFLRIRQ